MQKAACDGELDAKRPEDTAGLLSADVFERLQVRRSSEDLPRVKVVSNGVTRA